MHMHMKNDAYAYTINTQDESSHMIWLKNWPTSIGCQPGFRKT